MKEMNKIISDIHLKALAVELVVVSVLGILTSLFSDDEPDWGFCALSIIGIIVSLVILVFW